VLITTGCMVLQPFAVERNRSYPEFWAVTGGPQYPGYYTPIGVKLDTWAISAQNRRHNTRKVL
jgi:hypothetical protein